MADPYLAEVRLFGFNFAPRGYAKCDGQILPINQNQSLYSLLGTTYGGDGRTTFGLPDLRGRTPVHETSGFSLGSRGGEETHTLNQSEMPAHTHGLFALGEAATQPGPTGNLLAQSTLAGGTIYSTPSQTQDVSLHPAAIGNSGGNQGHENRQPYLTINFCIALQGVFPSRT